MSETARVALLGLPSTGKSTYLGALWALIDEPQFTSLKEVNVRGDRAYVQGLASAVIAAQAIERTHTETEDGLEVEVDFVGDGPVRLSLADRSGEQLRELVEERHWLPLLEAEADHADAVILFVHPAEVQLPLPSRVSTSVWSDSAYPEGQAPDRSPKERDAAEQDSERPVSAPASKPQASSKPAGFMNREAATAVKLVDGLENILERARDRWPLPIAVVISAFDLAGGRTPEGWLRSRLPAFLAFLENNPDRLEWAMFGVSAQGGALPDAREELLRKGDIQDRCFARAADGTPIPLSEPVRWAVGWR
jgi:hypothetical protein